MSRRNFSKSVKLYDITANDELRPAMQCVCFKDGYAYATEAHMLIKAKIEDICNFHPERRLGCIGCPLATKNRISELQQYPGMVKALVRAGRKFMDSHPNSKVHHWFEDEYEYFARQIFDKNKGIGSVALNKEALFKDDYKALLENYFKIKL